MTDTRTVYNASDGPLTIDRAGRQLGAGGWAEDVDVDAQPVKGHLAAGRMLVPDTGGDLMPTPDDVADNVAELADDADVIAAADDAASSSTPSRAGRSRRSTPDQEA